MPVESTGNCGEVYDTLDDFPCESLKNIKSLDDILLNPLKGSVGVVIGGICTLSNHSDGYWGRRFCLLTGEEIQVRQTPRGVVGRAVTKLESRIIAIRLTGPGICTQVFFAILFQPRLCVIGGEAVALTTARTIGCRGVHLLIPSLFNKHDPHRDTSRGHADLDLDGFHAIRPSCVTITKASSIGKNKKNGEISSMCPGDSYLVMAAHILGLDHPDPITRSSHSMTDEEHIKKISSTTRKISQHAGEVKASEAISSALTIADFLGAEGIIGMLCNSFFDGVLPDMLHSPIGIPLVIVMAIRIACYPTRFGLKQGVTQQDAYANRELCSTINSRWMPVSRDHLLAIDAVLDSGVKNTNERVKEEKWLSVALSDNINFWQRVGQRIITKIMSDQRSLASDGSHLNTRFGRADMVEDAVSDAKYKLLARAGVAQPVVEAPVNKLHLAPNGDMRSQLVRIHDQCEVWLRTGMYGEVRMGKTNSAGEAGEELCLDAMESATGAVSVAMLHGAFVVHQFGIKTYLVGDGCANICSDCEREITPLQGILLNSSLGECSRCNRRRCFDCAEKIALGERESKHGCKRCVGADT